MVLTKKNFWAATLRLIEQYKQREVQVNASALSQADIRALHLERQELQLLREQVKLRCALHRNWL